MSAMRKCDMKSFYFFLFFVSVIFVLLTKQMLCTFLVCVSKTVLYFEAVTVVAVCNLRYWIVNVNKVCSMKVVHISTVLFEVYYVGNLSFTTTRKLRLFSSIFKFNFVIAIRSKYIKCNSSTCNYFWLGVIFHNVSNSKL